MKKLLLTVFTSGLISSTNAQNFFCFTPQAATNVTNAPRGIASGDFNGDGNLDLATTKGNANKYSVMYGTASGSFGAAIDYTLAGYAENLTAGDFNGDFKADLAISVGNNSLSICLATASGTFAAPVNYSVANGPIQVATGKFNNDNILDLVVGCYTANRISVLMGNSNGTFISAINYTTGTNPYGICVLDINLDNKDDIISVNYGSNNLTLFTNSGSGTFANTSTLSTVTQPYFISSGFVNNDNIPDVVISSLAGNIGVHLGNTAGSIPQLNTITNVGSPRGISLAKFDGNNTTDLAFVDILAEVVKIYPGSGSGLFFPPTTFSTGANPVNIVVNDFNSDIRPDFAVTNANSFNVGVSLNKAVFFNSLPSQINICPGSTATITAFGAAGTSSYTFNAANAQGVSGQATFNSFTINPTFNTSTVLVSATNTFGCISDSQPVVIVKELPIVASTSETTICSGQSATLIASGASTYTWNTSSNSDTIVVTPTNTTTYTVIGTSTLGCVSNATISQNVQICTSISEVILKNNISIYPNPVSNAITINANKALGSVGIYDALGKLVITHHSNNLQTTIDISTLEKGMYFIRTNGINNKFIKD